MAVQLTVTPAPTGLPLASVMTVVMVEVLVPSAVIDAADVFEVADAALPAVKVTLAAVFTAPTVAVTLALPAVFALVSTTVATPLALVVDVALARWPRVVAQFTVVPATTALPWASLRVALSVEVVTPSAVIAAGEASTARAVAAPGVKITVVESVTEPVLAVTVPLPAVVGLVITTVASPLSLVTEVA